LISPKGTLYGTTRSYALQTDDQLLKSQDGATRIIAYRNGGPIRISDVGKAVIGPQDKTLAGWVNDTQGVVLAIQRLPGRERHQHGAAGQGAAARSSWRRCRRQSRRQ